MGKSNFLRKRHWTCYWKASNTLKAKKSMFQIPIQRSKLNRPFLKRHLIPPSLMYSTFIKWIRRLSKRYFQMEDYIMIVWSWLMVFMKPQKHGKRGTIWLKCQKSQWASICFIVAPSLFDVNRSRSISPFGFKTVILDYGKFSDRQHNLVRARCIGADLPCYFVSEQKSHPTKKIETVYGRKTQTWKGQLTMNNLQLPINNKTYQPTD